MSEQNAEIVSQIWNESRNRIKGFIVKRIGNESDAEDVLQNVFCKIHQNISDLKDPNKLMPWVFQTTRNAIIDFYRERKLVVDSSEELLGEIAIDQTGSNVEEEVLTWLEPMIRDLPENYSEALLLTDIKGLTQKELSEKLNISLSGAKTRVQRAREKLKEALLGCCRFEFNRSGQIIEYKQRNETCEVCSQ